MTIEEIFSALSVVIAGVTDETEKATLMDTISDGLKPLGYIPQTGVQTIIDSQTLGLKNKNTELLVTDKKLKDQVAALTVLTDDYNHLKNTLSDFGITLDKDGKLDDTKLEEFLESKSVDGGEAARNAVNLERTLRRVEREKKELERGVKDSLSELEVLRTEVSNEKNFNSKLMIDDQLTKSLYANGFEKPQVTVLIPYLKSISKAVVEFDETTGERTAITDDGKAVGEWVDWFVNKTDEGKALKPAPKNTGGGAGGNTGNRNNTVKPFADMTPAEKGELYVNDPNKYRQLRDSSTRVR